RVCSYVRFFFFSSRRRHTRSTRDWSSDVCSSDLVALELSAQPAATAREAEDALARAAVPLPAFVQYGRIDAGKTLALLHPAAARSEERRVGKECRAGGAQCDAEERKP